MAEEDAKELSRAYMKFSEQTNDLTRLTSKSVKSEKDKEKIKALDEVALEKNKLESAYNNLEKKNRSLIEQVKSVPDKEKLLEIESDILRITGVFEVDYSKEMISDINKNIRNISFIFSGIFIILFLISIILISNTLRIALFSQRFLIRSMQLVGATSSYILKPFLMRGLLYGFASGILSSSFLYFIIVFINERLNGSSMIVSIEKLSIIFIMLIIVGILMVLISTFTSVNRYLGSTLDDLYN